MAPHIDGMLSEGVDEWGCVWGNAGKSKFGEVCVHPLADWADLPNLKIPQIYEVERFHSVKNIPSELKDKYIVANGNSIYARILYLRGLENTWADIYEEPENLCKLIDIIVDMNIEIIKLYAKHGVDGYIFADDWGLQTSLMINPVKWREIWKPRYKRIFDACHENGIIPHMHSCGYILEILEDLIEIGLKVIEMDQQANMGFEALTKFRGRITFSVTVDIQAVMPKNDMDEIKRYCDDMVRYLGTDKGGLFVRWYGDPVGVGHTDEAIKTMCNHFLAMEGITL
jgi:uroporphyrinogen-III decarboxylase